MKNIIFSPHYDDAILSMGGFLQKNQDSIVANIFTYDMPEREKEDKVALNYLGVKNIVNLGYRYNRDRQGSENLEDLFIRLDLAINIPKDEDINIYFPLALPDLPYRHVDHILLTERIMSGIFKDLKIRWFFYEDLPYITLSKETAGLIDIQNEAEKHYGFKLTKNTEVMTRFDWEQKIKAACIYKTQGIEKNIARYNQQFEVFYEINL